LNCNPNILSGSKGLGTSGCSGIVGSIETSLERAVLNCNPNILSGSKGLGISGCSGIVGSMITSLEGAGASGDVKTNGVDVDVQKVSRSGEEK